MVAARSAAMAFNRVVDADIDARNPRTKMRHLPAGLLTAGLRVELRRGVSALVFLLAAGALNPLCLRLAPIALGVVLRLFVHKAIHVVVARGARLRAWGSLRRLPGSRFAVRSMLRILWLTAAVTLWTAGFDIIYSCQDYEFDRRAGLFSLPATARHLRGAVAVAAVSPRHARAACWRWSARLLSDLSRLAGVAVVAALLL